MPKFDVENDLSISRALSVLVAGRPTVEIGIDAIDEATGGFSLGQMVILGGYPGSGVDKLGLGLTLQLARNGLTVAYLSISNSSSYIHEGLILNILSDELYNFRPRPRDLNPAELHSAASTLRELPIQVVSPYSSSNVTFLRYLNKLKSSERYNVIFIDNIQSLVSTARESLYAEVSLLSRGLKQFAITTKTLLVVMSQLNRGFITDKNSPPELWNLRDSGCLEDDADIVILTHKVSPTKKTETSSTFVNVKKNRYGPNASARFGC